MSLAPFLLETVLISLSGVMAPGPISAVTVGKGSESPHAGAWVAIGHGIVEFPLIAAVSLGFGYLVEHAYVETAIALVGGAFLLVMGIGMLRGLRRAELGSSKTTRSPVLAGVLLSAGNPYFLIWWITVGAALIGRAGRFGGWGLLAFAGSHWMCDFVWSYLLSTLSFRGGRFFGARFQRAVFLASGVFLVFFGGKYIVDAAGALLA
jgi:threonine/homoserine/homoserine lactone efflux protein